VYLWDQVGTKEIEMRLMIHKAPPWFGNRIHKEENQGPDEEGCEDRTVEAAMRITLGAVLARAGIHWLNREDNFE